MFKNRLKDLTSAEKVQTLLLAIGVLVLIPVAFPLFSLGSTQITYLQIVSYSFMGASYLFCIIRPSAKFKDKVISLIMFLSIVFLAINKILLKW
ncbi:MULTISPECIES: hypothetical protein [Clostridium]|uniref:Uncharacterized protein n=2 Tax=Clostridium TaxID=1485 RepID=A0A151AM69_9CLOT|nr:MULTISPECIES: hypothetical protein [Clostridium]KYH28723.1 hypothetical protein CLCOL_17360 [Clostridium colicanis DSM 13634]PRR76980.1 hypothetical protein CPAL_00290 [Clostridium thermopalmarium DSM 5974]PVZ21211.1 hypothetical protein LX19_02250 [Clostridium thermopalmarium DSM 5974]